MVKGRFLLLLCHPTPNILINLTWRMNTINIIHSGSWYKTVKAICQAWLITSSRKHVEQKQDFTIFVCVLFFFLEIIFMKCDLIPDFLVCVSFFFKFYFCIKCVMEQLNANPRPCKVWLILHLKRQPTHKLLGAQSHVTKISISNNLVMRTMLMWDVRASSVNFLLCKEAIKEIHLILSISDR